MKPKEKKGHALEWKADALEARLESSGAEYKRTGEAMSTDPTKYNRGEVEEKKTK
jgi:hypothetical protein